MLARQAAAVESSNNDVWHVRLALLCRVAARGWVAGLALRTTSATGSAGVGQLRPPAVFTMHRSSQ